MNTYKSIPNQTLSLDHVNHVLHLSGWVMRRRDHGGVIFIDLRDQSGFCQIVFRPEISKNSHLMAQSLRLEWVIHVQGTVHKRTKETLNLSIPTGRVELNVHTLNILNKSQTPPFALDAEEPINEDTRLKYRCLDLRRTPMQQNLITRHHFVQAVRQELYAQHFIEIDTPILNKTTPEGARDYLVPSRIHPQNVYALPQSPQLFKQILMVSGFERYCQIAKCFRDEDLRADRQPEFSQIDLETAFLNKNQALHLYETILLSAMKKTFPKKKFPPHPLPHLSYAKSMEMYGTDRPDTRFDLKIFNPQNLLQNCRFQVFQNALNKDGIIRMLSVPNGATKLSRKDIDTLILFVQKFDAKGLAWMKITHNNTPNSNITKFFSHKELQDLVALTQAQKNDLFLFVADQAEITFDALANLRLHIAQKLHLIDQNKLNFLWINDFPLFQSNPKYPPLHAQHHPFTAPKSKHIPLLDTHPYDVLSEAYDLVLNGTEIGGGSLRIHDPLLQVKIFHLLGLKKEQVQTQFGFLLDALHYGAPPHGGIAFGLDRILAIMLQSKNIREVMAFPKTQRAQCLMSQTPSIPSPQQLKELHLFPKPS